MNEHSFEPIIVPFLKWAGGKRWLTASYAHLIPKKFDRYVEPFLGSGAVFFHLRPNSAVLSDSNAELINTYEQIRLNWQKISQALRRHQRNHCEAYYYEERTRARKAEHERAATFIYLNRVCWNGLYRVNLRGQFNVPIGTKNAVILDSDDFEEVSTILKRAKLVASDFETVLDRTGETDFVFIDPPYVTRHNFNGFAKYNDRIFNWKDQERLAAAVKRAARRGVKMLLTNANHASVRDLYNGVGRQITLTRNSVLAADSKNRGSITEIAVAVNYKAGARDVV
jgi:DNA adenine methylase